MGRKLSVERTKKQWHLPTKETLEVVMAARVTVRVPAMEGAAVMVVVVAASAMAGAAMIEVVAGKELQAESREQEGRLSWAMVKTMPLVKYGASWCTSIGHPQLSAPVAGRMHIYLLTQAFA